MRRPSPEFLRFCVVGTVGFVVDAGTTLMLALQWHWPAGSARIAAFVLAASVTWALHRQYTFGSRSGFGSWALYLVLTALGGGINFIVYLGWLQVAGRSALQLLVGVALGSAVALLFNYAISRRLVFRQRA